MDLPTGQDKKNPPIQVKIKSSFKQTEPFKNGKIYYNKTESVPTSWFDSIQKYGITHKLDMYREINLGTREATYQAQVSNIEKKVIALPQFDDSYIKKAIQRIPFYKFNNLSQYLPNIKSMHEFIYSEKWLNAKKLKLFVNVPMKYTSNAFSPDDILNITVDLLKEYEVKFKSGFIKERGTNQFVGYPIKEYLVDYKKRVPEYDTANLLIDATQKVAAYEMSDDFYVYEKAIVNKLEIELIERIKAHISDLKDKYNKNVFLFRMDENMHRESAKSNDLKLYQYGDRINRAGEEVDIHLQGFQPDFILFLENALMMRFRTSFSSLVKYHHRSIFIMVTRYEEDFKKSIVEMVKAGRRPDELAKEYGPSADSIRNWVKKYAPVNVNGELVSADELKKLRKELAILKEENEILKRAAVLLAKH